MDIQIIVGWWIVPLALSMWVSYMLFADGDFSEIDAFVLIVNFGFWFVIWVFSWLLYQAILFLKTVSISIGAAL